MQGVVTAGVVSPLVADGRVVPGMLLFRPVPRAQCDGTCRSPVPAILLTSSTRVPGCLHDACRPSASCSKPRKALPRQCNAWCAGGWRAGGSVASCDCLARFGCSVSSGATVFASPFATRMPIRRRLLLVHGIPIPILSQRRTHLLPRGPRPSRRARLLQDPRLGT